MKLTAPLSLAVAACIASASAATAQDDEAAERDARARAHFQAGAAAFDEGSYELAIELFRSAYALSERPALLYNIGTSADRLRRNDEAIEAFEAYLAALPDADNAAAVRRRLEVLRDELRRRRELEEAAAAGGGETTRRRRRRWGGALAAVAAIGGGVALALALSQRGAAAPPHDFVLQTVGGRR